MLVPRAGLWDLWAATLSLNAGLDRETLALTDASGAQRTAFRRQKMSCARRVSSLSRTEIRDIRTFTLMLSVVQKLVRDLRNSFPNSAYWKAL